MWNFFFSDTFSLTEVCLLLLFYKFVSGFGNRLWLRIKQRRGFAWTCKYCKAEEKSFKVSTNTKAATEILRYNHVHQFHRSE